MNPVPIHERVALTPEDAGHLLDLSRSAVYREIKAGRLRPIANRRPLRIARTEIDRYASSSHAAPATASSPASVIPIRSVS